MDKGESMCVMSTLVWHKLGSPILQPSSTNLQAYDDHPTKAQGIIPHVPITLARKIVLIDIDVFNDQLDYNLLLRRSYMYTMRAVASNVFHLMMFPHEGKIMTLDQLTYHNLQGLTVTANVIPTINTIDLQGLNKPTNVIPMVDTMVDNIPASPLLNVDPGLFVDTTMTAYFPLVSPPLTPNKTADLCML